MENKKRKMRNQKEGRRQHGNSENMAKTRKDAKPSPVKNFMSPSTGLAVLLLEKLDSDSCDRAQIVDLLSDEKHQVIILDAGSSDNFLVSGIQMENREDFENRHFSKYIKKLRNNATGWDVRTITCSSKFDPLAYLTAFEVVPKVSSNGLYSMVVEDPRNPQMENGDWLFRAIRKYYPSAHQSTNDDKTVFFEFEHALDLLAAYNDLKPRRQVHPSLTWKDSLTSNDCTSWETSATWIIPDFRTFAEHEDVLPHLGSLKKESDTEVYPIHGFTSNCIILKCNKADSQKALASLPHCYVVPINWDLLPGRFSSQCFTWLMWRNVSMRFDNIKSISKEDWNETLQLLEKDTLPNARHCNEMAVVTFSTNPIPDDQSYLSKKFSNGGGQVLVHETELGSRIDFLCHNEDFAETISTLSKGIVCTAEDLGFHFEPFLSESDLLNLNDENPAEFTRMLQLGLFETITIEDEKLKATFKSVAEINNFLFVFYPKFHSLGILKKAESVMSLVPNRYGSYEAEFLFYKCLRSTKLFRTKSELLRFITSNIIFSLFTINTDNINKMSAKSDQQRQHTIIGLKDMNDGSKDDTDQNGDLARELHDDYGEKKSLSGANSLMHSKDLLGNDQSKATIKEAKTKAGNTAFGDTMQDKDFVIELHSIREDSEIVVHEQKTLPDEFLMEGDMSPQQIVGPSSENEDDRDQVRAACEGTPSLESTSKNFNLMDLDETQLNQMFMIESKCHQSAHHSSDVGHDSFPVSQNDSPACDKGISSDNLTIPIGDFATNNAQASQSEVLACDEPDEVYEYSDPTQKTRNEMAKDEESGDIYASKLGADAKQLAAGNGSSTDASTEREPPVASEEPRLQHLYKLNIAVDPSLTLTRTFSMLKIFSPETIHLEMKDNKMVAQLAFKDRVQADRVSAIYNAKLF